VQQGEVVSLVAPAASCYLFDGEGRAFPRRAPGQAQRAA
jgi:hypothetical protein